MKRMGVLAVVLGLSTAVWGGTITYSQNFNSMTAGTIDGTATYDYWFSSDPASPFSCSSAYWTSQRLWMSRIFATGWIYNYNAFRNFRTSGQLDAQTYLTSPTLTGSCKNSSITIKTSNPATYFRIKLLDETQSGYVGQVNYYGAMVIYRMDNGTQVSIASNDGTSNPDGNGKTLSLSVIDGMVTFQYTPEGSTDVYTLTASDATYTLFTQIGFGGDNHDIGGWGGTAVKQFNLDDVTLTAQTFNPTTITF